MPKYSQKFYVNGQLLGEMERHGVRKWGEEFEPRSTVYVCGGCGEVWARAPVWDEKGRCLPWQCAMSCCPNCPSLWGMYAVVPGSLVWWDFSEVAEWPQEVLRYEFNVTLKQWEKENGTLRESVQSGGSSASTDGRASAGNIRSEYAPI